MLSNNQSKLIRALHLKKYRQKYRKFTVEGDKMVSELLQQKRLVIEAVFALPDWITTHQALLAPLQTDVFPVTEQELKKITALSTPNQALAVARMPEASPVPQPQPGLNLYLDGIQDPGNLGAILRIADWFGMPAVYCSEDTADLYNPKVIQASMGAFLRVDLFPCPLEQLQTMTQGHQILAADMEGDNLFATTLPRDAVLIVGNEGNGLSETARSLAGRRLHIPAGEGSGAESLNAAVATGIFAACWYQQRHFVVK